MPSLYLVVLHFLPCLAIPRGPGAHHSMSDAEEQQRSARVSKTDWTRDARILDYRGGAVPDKLRGHLCVLSGVLAPGEERIMPRLGPHFITGTVFE